MKKSITLALGFMILSVAPARAIPETRESLTQAKVESGRRFGEYGGGKVLKDAPTAVSAGTGIAAIEQLSRAAEIPQEASLKMPKPASARLKIRERSEAKRDIASGLLWGGLGAAALAFPVGGLVLGWMALASGAVCVAHKDYLLGACFMAVGVLALAVPQAGALAAVAIGASRLFYGLTKLFS